MLTRTEAEAQVREIQKLCKGPELVDRLIQEAFMARIASCTIATLPTLVQDVMDLRRQLGFSGDKIYPDVGGENALLAWCLESIRSHQSDVGNGCGRDFNDEVCAHPFDGEVREYRCPSCGLGGTFRSPYIETVG